MGVPVDIHGTGKSTKVIVPIPMDSAGVANRTLQLPANFVVPGFRPDFAAMAWAASLGDGHHDMLKHVCMSGESPLV